MLASSQTITPRPAALPPAAQPAQPGSASTGGPSFAQFLNDQPALPPAHSNPMPREADGAGECQPAPAPAANAPTARRPQANAAKPPAAPAPGRMPDGKTDAARPPKEGIACEASDGDKAKARDADKAPATSGLDEFTQLVGLAALNPSAPGTPLPIEKAGTAGNEAAARGAHAARSSPAVDEAAASGPAEAKAASPNERRPADTSARAADASHAKAGIELPAEKATTVPSSRSAEVVTTAASPATGPHAVTGTDGAPTSFTAMLAQAQPTTTGAADATPVMADGRVHAPLHSSAFAPELAASVSLLAVDGVQQAELQLNPADMGPVAVQIVVDGSQAQVSFHAVQAETRQALEQSLPDLAAALQGQGLTLSGGGVFQQARRDADHDQDRSDASGTARASRGGSDRIGATAASTTAPARRSVGLLDTFA